MQALSKPIIKTKTIIYTDGACSNNPGPGGWAAIFLQNEVGEEKTIKKTISGGEALTTNNRMELLAIINALKLLETSTKLVIYTDSEYVKKGIADWIHSWKKNNWLTAAKKSVKNQDLWKELDILIRDHSIEWLWVRAHNGDLYNEKVDVLARTACEKYKRK